MKKTFSISLMRQPFVHRLYEKVSLTLEMPVNDWLVAQGMAEAMSEPGDYEVTISIKNKKRSLDANNFAWALISKIAAHYHKSIEEVYRENIRELGTCDIVCIQENAFDDFQRRWEGKGIGWMCEQLDSKLEGCVNAVCWYGSSTYTSKEMSQLIENLLQLCRDENIYIDEKELKEVKIGRAHV